jgi:outer membrane protein
MKAADRTKLEKDIQAQRQDLAQKGQAFEQDRLVVLTKNVAS